MKQLIFWVILITLVFYGCNGNKKEKASNANHEKKEKSNGNFFLDDEGTLKPEKKKLNRQTTKIIAKFHPDTTGGSTPVKDVEVIKEDDTIMAEDTVANLKKEKMEQLIEENTKLKYDKLALLEENKILTTENLTFLKEKIKSNDEKAESILKTMELIEGNIALTEENTKLKHENAKLKLDKDSLQYLIEVNNDTRKEGILSSLDSLYQTVIRLNKKGKSQKIDSLLTARFKGTDKEQLGKIYRAGISKEVYLTSGLDPHPLEDSTIMKTIFFHGLLDKDYAGIDIDISTTPYDGQAFIGSIFRETPFLIEDRKSGIIKKTPLTAKEWYAIWREYSKGQ